MKLLTLNCHSWQEEDQLEKIRHLAETIKSEDYDVIALQEVSQHRASKDYKDNLKEENFLVVLLKELEKLNVNEYDSVWDYAHIGYDVYEEGVCLLSKHPIVDKESFIISKCQSMENWKTRKIVKCTITYNDELIDFYSCHLGWWADDEEPFSAQMDKLYEIINPSRQSFLLGDFNNNACIRNEGYDYMKSLGLIDTYDLAVEKDSGMTVKGKIAGWEENEENLRLDLIMTNKPLEVKSSKVIFNGKNKQVVSDHYGVQVEIIK